MGGVIGVVHESLPLTARRAPSSGVRSGGAWLTASTGIARRQRGCADSPEVIRHRLAVSAAETAPVVDHDRECGVPVEVDPDRPVDVTRAHLEQRSADRGMLVRRAFADRPGGAVGRAHDDVEDR